MQHVASAQCHAARCSAVQGRWWGPAEGTSNWCGHRGGLSSLPLAVVTAAMLQGLRSDCGPSCTVQTGREDSDCVWPCRVHTHLYGICIIHERVCRKGVLTCDPMHTSKCCMDAHITGGGHGFHLQNASLCPACCIGGQEWPAARTWHGSARRTPRHAVHIAT